MNTKACTLEYPSLTGFLHKITNNSDCAGLEFVQWEINKIKKRIDTLSKNKVGPQDIQSPTIKEQIDTLFKITAVAAEQIQSGKTIGFKSFGNSPANLADIDRLNKELDALKKSI